MAASKDSILNDVKKYISELQKCGIPVQKALLFGSWSRGVQLEESDIDVAVISEVFTGDRFQDRRQIVPLRRKINTRIEPVPFNPQTFNEGGNLVDEIIRYGEEIKT